MRWAALFVVLAAAACGPSRPPSEPLSPEAAECRREARASTEMRDLFRAAAPDEGWRLERDRRLLEDRLTRECLQRKGLLRPGVAPVVPPLL